MRGRGIVLAVLVAALGGPFVSGQGDPWIARSPRLAVTDLPAPSGEWRLQHPRRDWVIGLSGGTTLALLMHKNAEASVALQRIRPCVEIQASELTDDFLEVEVALVKEEQPDAKGIEQRIERPDGRRVFIVQFERQGLKGSERVRQYCFPVGTRLYRLLCSAPVSQFTKHAPTFAHIAASLMIKEQ